MCEILTIYNNCLNVGSLELGNNKLCYKMYSHSVEIVVLDLISIASYKDWWKWRTYSLIKKSSLFFIF